MPIFDIPNQEPDFSMGSSTIVRSGKGFRLTMEIAHHDQDPIEIALHLTGLAAMLLDRALSDGDEDEGEDGKIGS